MKTSRAELERALTMRLGPLATSWHQLASRELGNFRVSESEARALAYLDRLGPGTRQGDLARALAISEASLVRTLHRLEGMELIQRISDENDRRAKCLQLTATGADLAARIDAALRDVRHRLLEDLEDDALERLVARMQTLMTIIEEWRGRP